MKRSRRHAFVMVAISLCVACAFAQQQSTPSTQASPLPEASRPSDSTLAGSKNVPPQEESLRWDTKTIVAAGAAFVSLVSLISSIYFSLKAREHNRLSVRPMPYILQPDYDNRTAVIIQNNGTGPMIIQKVEAKTDSRVGHLMDLIPALPEHMRFTNFNRIEQARPIRPGDHVDLLDLSINQNDPMAVGYRDELREALGDMSLEVTYTDVYKSRFRIYSHKLDWFHRHHRQTPDS